MRVGIDRQPEAVDHCYILTAVSRTISTATPMIVSYLLSSGSLAAASLAQLVTFAILARALGPAEFGLFVADIGGDRDRGADLRPRRLRLPAAQGRARAGELS